MKFVIITGMSGAGKTKAVEAFEDIGYFCVDNMPISFVTKFAEICLINRSELKKAAIVIDVRSGHNFENIKEELDKLSVMGIEYEILFLDAANSVISRRYKETRRPHPFFRASDNFDIKEALVKEREIIKPLYNNAKHIIDTSFINPPQLRNQLKMIFAEGERSIAVYITSFGFKHGIAGNADMVFDVRCLPNPYYDKNISHLSGLDEEVRNYVFQFHQSQDYLDKIIDMLDFTMPHFIEEGKTILNIAIGCTGGRHRSVSFTLKLEEHFKKNNIHVRVHHRDLVL